MHAGGESGAVSAGAARRRFRGLMLGSIGVVFGDIGTSPIYTFKTALGQAAKSVIAQDEIFGIISLMLWALIIVVTIKYVSFIMRADNKGEGGILSLMALAQGAVGGLRTHTVLLLGVVGAALFYGDAIITPAISVLSAVEGLKTAPALTNVITPGVEIAIALVILITLFSAQSRGTARVANWFGPICLAWFAAIAALGILHLVDAPQILWAFNPLNGVAFLAHHGVTSLFVLGSVSLTITGAEALYADMGHFGRRPIRYAWLLVVFPALALNYLGQGAFVLHFLETPANRAVKLGDQDWFFLMAPEILRIPMVILANAATVIASQAVISGAYSMSNAAMQMGLLPRLHVLRTSETEAGQIYMPTINLLLMVGVIFLIAVFKNSDNLANAYGLAVTGTMSVTTALAAIVARRLWKWSWLKTGLVVTPLLAVDLTLLSGNSLKLLDGGWVPLGLGGAVLLLILTWMHGSDVIARKARKERIPLNDFLASLARRPRPRVPGTAVFLTSEPMLAPSALLHNLKHNGILHEKNVIVSVATVDTPRAQAAERAKVEPLENGFYRVILDFGFMETPNVPKAMRGLVIGEAPLEAMATSYFLGRRTIVPGAHHGLRRLRDLLFVALARNSANPSDVFDIPPGRVIEMGVQVSV